MDGSIQSVSNVLQILKEFEAVSGLAISLPKTTFYASGLSDEEVHHISSTTGISSNSLPVRYLGLPLNSKKLTLLGCAPLLQSVKTKLSSWSSRALSFAGRLQLLNSVISGITTFWCSAFILPKACIRQINSLCGAFLWHGTTEGSHSAKVSWEICTLSKKEGGLGLRDLLTWNRASTLKIIWLLFFKSGSVWVAWFINEFLSGNLSFFWIKKESQSYSWLINKLLRLRPLVYSWIKLQLGNGQSCLFWSDNWTPFGRLESFLNRSSSTSWGIPTTARVSSLFSNGTWVLRAARSDNQVILLAHLSSTPLSPQSDSYTWWINDQFRNKSNIGTIYEAIKFHASEVDWSSIIWSSGGIPKHKFITWLFTLNRCPTKDRLCSWGLQVNPICLLCATHPESRNHLFFLCPFSSEIWIQVVARCRLPLSRDWNHLISTLSTLSCSRSRRKLILMAWQATIYYIWSERNARLHRNLFRSPPLIFTQIDQTVRSRALSFSDTNPTLTSDILQEWFSTTI